ncbi:MAG: UDP-4-amino-4,6-dideoxy-N-acetyl-beta-L-altrosamine transaminase [Desulfobacterales bacterium]|nr:UDP-4-amino-4,6-dideoxy-N-acetyl-beta-L-altrosamine transaminase [Desulfobacterales bacterium]
MFKDPLHYTRQWIDQDDIQAVADSLASPFITTGPAVTRLEEELQLLTGAPHAVVCSNGTAALHLACMAAGIQPGEIGITSPISFLASANCVEYCGGKADFLDIDPQTLCLDPRALAEYCEHKAPPRVVIPVDFAGTPADLPAFRKLADKYGFILIEDAAHALGSTYSHQGKEYACGACAHTDMAVFSFHPAKTATAGEGGAVLTRDAELAKRLRQLRSHGMIPASELGDDIDGPWAYAMESPGYNYRITDFQCALLSSQLKKLDRFKKRRQEIVSLYQNRFQDHPHLIPPPDDLRQGVCPHLYPLQFKGGKGVRKSVYLGLREDNIYCQVHYIPIHFQPYYRDKYGYAKGKCPHGERYYDRALSLPLFPALTDAEVEFIIQRLVAKL